MHFVQIPCKLTRLWKERKRYMTVKHTAAAQTLPALRHPGGHRLTSSAESINNVISIRAAAHGLQRHSFDLFIFHAVACHDKLGTQQLWTATAKLFIFLHQDLNISLLPERARERETGSSFANCRHPTLAFSFGSHPPPR